MAEAAPSATRRGRPGLVLLFAALGVMVAAGIVAVVVATVLELHRQQSAAAARVSAGLLAGLYEDPDAVLAAIRRLRTEGDAPTRETLRWAGRCLDRWADALERDGREGLQVAERVEFRLAGLAAERGLQIRRGQQGQEANRMLFSAALMRALAAETRGEPADGNGAVAAFTQAMRLVRSLIQNAGWSDPYFANMLQFTMQTFPGLIREELPAYVAPYCP